MRLFDGTPLNGLIFDIALRRTSQHRKRRNVKGGRPTVVSRSVGRGLVRAATLKKLPRVRVNANGRTLRIQRKVASSEKTANLTAEAKYDGASRGIHAAYFHIHVSAKVLSCASDETRISRVRRLSFAAAPRLSQQQKERRCGNA